MLTAIEAGAQTPRTDMPDRSVIERLTRDHDKIRALCRELVAILSRTEPSEMERLATLRWDMASTIMSHVAVEDRALYSRLAGDTRAHVNSVAIRFRDELSEKFESYSTHARDWTPQRICADWDVYRKQSLRFLDWLMARADREEAQLFPIMLVGLHDSRAQNPVVVSWARDAFAIKDSIIGR